MLAQGLTLPQPNQPRSVTVGTMTATPLAVVLQRERAAASERATKAAQEPAVSGLVSMLEKHWTSAKRAKEKVEREMLEAVRSRRGEYHPEKLAELKAQGGSLIYMMIFATKARQFKALINDVLIGAGSEKPWTLNHSPDPEIPPDQIEQIMQSVQEFVMQAEMSGAAMSVADIRQILRDAKGAAEKMILEEARTQAERASVVVEDILVEGGWLEALDQFIDDLAVFKTAFIKGPVMYNAFDLQWAQQPDGSYAPVVERRIKPHWVRVDPMMMYPSNGAKNVNDSYLIERHKLSRGELEQLIGVEGYSEDAIRAVLDAHGTGGLKEWLTVDAEKAHAEGREATLESVSGADQIDALQYWGSVSGKMLIEWGMSADEVQDEAKEYQVELWKIGTWVIKAALNPEPLGRRPYYADGFSRVPGAFWHESLFDVVSDCQDMANAAARALANNMGIGSGPQAVVNVDRIPAGEDITEMYPWKIWQTLSDPSGSSAIPVTFFQPSSNANELMGVFEKFSQMADDYAGLPKYMSGLSGGEGGAGRTASGMSMMITNASKQIKQTVASIDMHIIGPSVKGGYYHALQHMPQKKLSGDLQAQARGAISMVAKETAMLRTNEFLMATANPIDMQIIGMDGRAELLRHAAKRLDLNVDKVVPSESVVKQRAAAAAAQQAQQQMMEQQAQGGQAGMSGSGQTLMDGAPTTDSFTPQPKPAQASM